MTATQLLRAIAALIDQLNEGLQVLADPNASQSERDQVFQQLAAEADAWRYAAEHYEPAGHARAAG